MVGTTARHTGIQASIRGTLYSGTFVSTGACSLVVSGSNAVSNICHRGCAYTVIQTVQGHGVCSAVYGTVQDKEPLKSFKIRVAHGPGLGFSFCCDIASLCRKRLKAIFTHSLTLYQASN